MVSISHIGPLRPLVECKSKKKTERANKQLRAFLEWIDAAHFYRYEPGTDEPAQPPLELAIELVSIGAAFIRRLARLDPG